MFILGMDVSKDTLAVHLLCNSQSMIALFGNHKAGWKSLRNWLKKRCKQQPTHVCLEATGRYAEGVTSSLHQSGYLVSIVNLARIKAYAQSLLSRNKTDITDAAIIAEFCRTQRDSLSVWSPPDLAQKLLQALVRRLDDLEKMRQQERNRLKASQHQDMVLQHLQNHIAFLDGEISDIKQSIAQHINQHPHLKHKHDLIVLIFGIGSLTAAKILAHIPNIEDFDSPKQLVAYAGLNPKQRRSGSSVRGKSHISKIGHASIRSALYLPAVVAKNRNPLLQPFVQRLKLTGHCPMSIIVAVMRKLLHLVYGILKSEQPFDPDYLKTQDFIS